MGGFLRLVDRTEQLASHSYPLFELAARTPIPRRLEPFGGRVAFRAAMHAYGRVPAYRDFVDSHGWSDDPSLSGPFRLARLPMTDKASYVLRYSIAERCVDGRVPLRGTEMDESSGSSGKPYNWVRGQAELAEMHAKFAQYATFAFGRELVTLNAFSMGAWSTGVNTARAMRRNGMVKSIGPDAEKIVDTLRVLGTGYTYVVAGYPPFLRDVLDYGESDGLDWSGYRMYGLVGGEGMSEQLRDRLLTRFMAVYSAYGASDLDIGMGAETPLTIWVRRQAAAIPELRQALFGEDPRLPMLFQFNPLDHNIEAVDGELVITVCRLSLISPRIRYNVHDAGGAHAFHEVIEACTAVGLQPPLGGDERGRRALRLPFMYVHGRSDSTISYMGANIYPEDVEQALFTDSHLAQRLGAFALELRELGGGDVRPCVHVELSDRGADDAQVISALREAVINRLATNSRDFRAAMIESPTTAQVMIELHDPGTGPFAENLRRVKRRYIIPSQSHD